MNVASLELCKELYGLSGWGHGMGNRTAWEYTQYEEGSNWRVTPWGYGVCYASHVAYDLGYLLRKLPANIYIQQRSEHARWWCIWHSVLEVLEVDEGKSITEIRPDHLQASADTPEDAACKLAIELFQQGILKRDNVVGDTF